VADRDGGRRRAEKEDQFTTRWNGAARASEEQEVAGAK